jgi:hypothetical protein
VLDAEPDWLSFMSFSALAGVEAGNATNESERFFQVA